MASTPSDHEVAKAVDAQTPEVAADPNDTNSSNLFIRTLLSRHPSDEEPLTPERDSLSTNVKVDAVELPNIHLPTPSSHVSTRSGHSTPSRHAPKGSSTVPTSPIQPDSPHIKAGSDPKLVAVKEDQAPSNAEALPLAAQPAGETARRSTSSSDSSADATDGSNSSSDARRRGDRQHKTTQPQMIWNVGQQFDKESPPPPLPPLEPEPEPQPALAPARKRTPRRRRPNYHQVFVDQKPAEEREPEHIVLLRRVVRLQQLQTVFVGAASIIVAAVALYRH